MQHPDSYKEANSSKSYASLENSYGIVLQETMSSAQLEPVEREHLPPAPKLCAFGHISCCHQ